MSRSTSLTAAAGACMAVALVAIVCSVAARSNGDRAGWLGACAVAGCTAAACMYLLGRAHEAVSNERRSHR